MKKKIGDKKEMADKATKRDKKEKVVETQEAAEMVSRAEYDKLLKMIEELTKKAQGNSTPTVVNIRQDEEKVSLMFMAAVAKGTSVDLGTLGRIYKAGGVIEVPKRKFMEGTTPLVERLLANRKLVVVDGLTDEERERYQLKYKDGELLTQNAFFGMLDLKEAEICEIFKKLCFTHRQIVAKTYLEAWRNNDTRVSLATVKKLNAISKENGVSGMFVPIIDEMADKLKEED